MGSFTGVGGCSDHVGVSSARPGKGVSSYRIHKLTHIILTMSETFQFAPRLTNDTVRSRVCTEGEYI